MIFRHPEIFWALWALLIPVIIHLFDFRKNKNVYFPDIRFLKQVKLSSSKPLKLKQYLILFARLGAIFFLVMMFAQPTIPADSKKQVGNGAVVVYLDNSQSMTARINEQQSGLESAKHIGLQIVDQFDRSQEVILITNDDFGTFPTPINSEEASKKIISIGFSDKEFSLDKLAMLKANFEKRGSFFSDIFIISDFQKSTSFISNSKLDTSLVYWLSPIKTINQSNGVVDSVYVVAKNIAADRNTTMEVVIANYGAQQKEDLSVKIFIGDRQVSASSITIAPNQKERISFSLGKINSAASGYIQLEDYPNTFDNLFYFSIPPHNLINVVEIIGNEPASNIRSVFGNTAIFNMVTNNYQNIEADKFENANFIILNQISSPPIELIKNIKQFAQKGGSVFVIPSAKFDVSIYKSLNIQLTPNTKGVNKMLTAPSANLPFFKGVLENNRKGFKMFSSTPVWDWGTDKSALLSFEDGSPFLSELSNNIFIVRSPLMQPYSGFQSHALFVPVMYGLASKSVAPVGKNFNRLDEEYYEVLLDSVELKDLIRLKKGAIEFIPNKVKSGANWRISFPKNNIRAGIYNIILDTKTKGYLALNLTKKESVLTLLTKKEIGQLFSEKKVHFLDRFTGNQNKLEPFDTGIPLWKYALTFCLLFLLAEVLFIRFL